MELLQLYSRHQPLFILLSGFGTQVVSRAVIFLKSPAASKAGRCARFRLARLGGVKKGKCRLVNARRGKREHASKCAKCQTWRRMRLAIDW